MSSCGDTATAQDDGTSVCQNYGCVTGDWSPGTGCVCAFELETGGSVLEDDGEGTVVRVRIASVVRVRCRGVGVIISQSEVHSPVLMGLSQIRARKDTKRVQHVVDVVLAKTVLKNSKASFRPWSANDRYRGTGISALRSGERSMVNFWSEVVLCMALVLRMPRRGYFALSAAASC